MKKKIKIVLNRETALLLESEAKKRKIKKDDLLFFLAGAMHQKKF